MRAVDRMRLAVLLPAFLICACGGGATITQSAGVTTQAASPTISINAEQNGAVLVTLASNTSSAVIYYTIDGSAPSTSSIHTSRLSWSLPISPSEPLPTAPDTTASASPPGFQPNIPSGTLVWSDEFSNSPPAIPSPDPPVWVFDSGPGSNFGNSELETYCAGASSAAPATRPTQTPISMRRNPAHRRPSTVAGVYTSGRIKTQDLFSFQYGRIEARMKLPESQGMWPAFWLLGNNIATIDWPACGEIDVMEHIDGATLKTRASTGFRERSTAQHKQWHPIPSCRILRRLLAHLRHDLEQRSDPVLR